MEQKEIEVKPKIHFCNAGNITNDRCYRLGYLCQNCNYFNPPQVEQVKNNPVTV